MKHLSTKMILLIGLPTLAIYVVVLGAAMVHLRESAEEDVHREMSRMADHFAANFNRAFHEAAAIAVVTARFMENAPPGSLDQVYAQLEANVASNPVVYGAAMAFAPGPDDADKDLVCPYVYRSADGLARMNIGRDVYDWYADEQWEWWHVPVKAGRGVWCDPYFDEGAGNVLMVTYSEPFVRDGELVGVTTVDIMLPTLRESVADQILGTLDFLIVTKAGMYVFSSNTKEIMSRTIFDDARDLQNDELEDLAKRLTLGTRGVTSVQGWDSSERMMVFFAPIASTGWGFAARISERDAFARTNAQIRSAMIAMTLALALIIGSILGVSRRITRPLVALRAQVREIATGNLDARIEHVSGKDEIAELSRAFNRMGGDLRDNMERLATERTAREKMERDLDLAREIQRGLLPKVKPIIPGFEIEGWNLAADQTGGDYFDWLTLPDGRSIITLADVAGHGIGPALMVSLCRAYTRASAMESNVELVSAVHRVNALLSADMPEGKFITAAFGVIDPRTSEMLVLSAGQAPLLFYEAASDTLHEWHADTLPLGIDVSMEVAPPRVIQFQPGDVLVLVTDGFFEWRNTQGQRFGVRGLREFIMHNHALPPDELIQQLHALYLAATQGMVQEDDLTAVVIRRVSTS